MINMSRPKKIAITTSSLVETQLERPMHFWRCGKSNHTKNNLNYHKKKKILHMKKLKPKKEMAKVEDKSKNI